MEKNLLVKKLIIIFSVILVIIAAAVTIALVSGNTQTPALSEPDGVFYQRLDDNGKVIYTITNQELFDEIKSNDGLTQLLYYVDSYLLQDYLAALTDEQIANKILDLTYGTHDQAEIDALSADDKATMEDSFHQNMVLAGYGDSEAAAEEYASLLLARQEYTRYAMEADGDITDSAIGTEYATKWFEDIKAIKIRFTSSTDLKNVMRKFNLLSYSSTTIRSYLGFVYTNESLVEKYNVDDPTKIIEAYITVTPYYTDDSGNLLNLSGTIVYTKGTDIYTDASANEYTMDGDGNLLDEDSLIVVSHELIFTDSTLATAYQQANTEYFTVSKVDAFDEDEDAVVKNAANEVVYTIDGDGKIWEGAVDVTDTTELQVNKVYKAIANVSTTTVNNSAEMSNEEVLAAYIKMYNYVYGDYRNALPEDATADDLIALDNEYLTQNFDETYAISTSLATYMFSTLDINEDEDAIPYSPVGKTYNGSNDTNVYLIYKLTQPEKVNVYQRMIDYVKANVELVIPSQTTGNITLPTKGWYSSTITWSASSDSTVLTTAGVVTVPDEDTTVTLTYKIVCNGITRSGLTVSVKVLGSSTTESTSEIGTVSDTEVTVETIMNDADLYKSVRDQLIQDALDDTDNSSDTINEKLAAMRADCGFDIYDYYLGIDYQGIASDYELNLKGSKKHIATLTGRIGYLGADGVTEDTEITADDLLEYCLTKNVALYTLYAVQFKEMVYSQYYLSAFGSQTNLRKNTSDKMQDMLDSVANVKSYYVYYQNLYAQYGLDFGYATFADYAYSVYGTRSEYELLQYFVEGAIQPFIVHEAIDQYDLLSLFTDTIQERYDEYFSLYVTHLLLFVDFDEDGSPDDFNEYKAQLQADGKYDEFLARMNAFETAILAYLDDTESDNDFDSLVTDYRAATRDDATWGAFKQYGFLLLTENLDQTDDDDVEHSMEFNGDYGVQDTYVPEFIDALKSIYEDYRLDQNSSLSELRGSNLFPTEYGLHLLLVTKGDYFTQYSAAFAEADPENPVYSTGCENASDIPSAEQIALYAQYYFYSVVYDLTDEEVESKYGITVPNIPASVSSAIDFYAGDLIESLYVVGLVNVRTSDLIVQGNWVANDYTSLTDAQIKAMLAEVKSVYYDALFADYQN